jgi:hypothetical protein
MIRIFMQAEREGDWFRTGVALPLFNIDMSWSAHMKHNGTGDERAKLNPNVCVL